MKSMSEKIFRVMNCRGLGRVDYLLRGEEVPEWIDLLDWVSRLGGEEPMDLVASSTETWLHLWQST